MSLKRTINNERFQRYFKNISTIVLSKEKSLSMKKERCGTREKEKNTPSWDVSTLSICCFSFYDPLRRVVFIYILEKKWFHVLRIMR